MNHGLICRLHSFDSWNTFALDFYSRRTETYIVEYITWSRKLKAKYFVRYSVYGLHHVKTRVINMHDKVLNGIPIFMGVEYKTLNLLIVIYCAKLHQRCPYSLKARE